MFWDDGTLSGEGKDESGDYQISGKIGKRAVTWLKILYTARISNGNVESVQLQVTKEKDCECGARFNCFQFPGTYDLASGTMKFVQEQYIASAEYDAQFEFTPDTEDADGTCKSRHNFKNYEHSPASHPGAACSLQDLSEA